MDELETRAIYPIEALEYRQEGREITGGFPFNKEAVISDRGRVRKEKIRPGAFDFAIQDETRDIHLLRGHMFDQPIANKRGGTLELDSQRGGLFFRALLPPENERPTYMRDTLLMLRRGLLAGISPSFRVPPREVVEGAEELEEEDGNPGCS